MEDKVRTEVDKRGNVIVLVQTACAVCRKCWKNRDTGRCIYGGPFDGFVRE